MAVNFCGNCGNKLEPNELFCTKCGARVENAQPAQQPVQPQAYQQPPTYPQYQQPQPYQQYGYTPAPEPKQSPGLAIAAFIISFFFAPIGLILGIIGMTKYKKQYRGFCAAAIAIGASFTVIQLLVGAIVIPSMINYINLSRRYSENYAASETKGSEVHRSLTGADTNGSDVRPDSAVGFDLTVNGETWTVSAAV